MRTTPEGEINLQDVPFANWLEEVLPQVCRMDAKSVAILCVNHDGTMGTAYYNAVAGDKGTMAWQLILDGVWDMITVNADRLKERLEEVGDEDEDEDADEDEVADSSLCSE